ncbi:MAG: tetratricopeptide repeat protein [Rhodobacteraceae bacterium]|nr:tetratricopeptide repeat protein [Paracoccaceae bacterium]
MQFLEQNAVLISAIAALLAIVGAVFVGVRWVKHRIKPAAPQVTPVQVMPNDGETKLTIIDFIRIRRELRAEIMAELDRTDASERAQLQARIDELTAQINNPEGAFETERKRLADLEARLVREGNELGAERLQSAIDALRKGNTDQAKDIFIEIAAREEPAVKRAARAEFGLGEIAESRLEWASAARHYARAAELDPTYDSLVKAGHFLGRAGQYSAALEKEKKLVALSRQEHGPRAPRTATALNNYANTLRVAGRYTEAEPLFHEALAIGRETLCERHPIVAIILNNLAGLLQDTGHLSEAEPLYREALEIGRETLRYGHPDTVARLNNLSGLLSSMGRHAEAEPLFREAVAIGRAKLGDHHPDVAGCLNNLAELLRATGRYSEAEPLYREALLISREALSYRHPTVAACLNNLALLLKATDRGHHATPLYLEALDINRTSLGDDHPTTQTTAQNTLIHLREHAPDHPDLAGLIAVFGDGG